MAMMMIDPRRYIGFSQLTSILLTLGLVSQLQVDRIVALESHPNQTIDRPLVNTSRNATTTSNHSAATTNRTQHSRQPNDECARKSGCSTRPSQVDLGLHRPACYCDQICALYDDCCHDSSWAEAASKRAELGASRLRARRREWVCRRVDPTRPGIYLRASCHPDWVRKQERNSTAEIVRQRCELAGAPGGPSGQADASWFYSDPMGSLMPITDLTSGITYANSYCLRCNTFGGLQQKASHRKRIYWSPMVSCNYNRDSDDRNALIDLISAKGGRALSYSRRLNKWFIKMDDHQAAASNNTTASKRKPDDESNDLNMERVCSVSARVPDSVSRIIRYCRPRTVDACPPSIARQLANGTLNGPSRELERAQNECQFGHQALVYSQTRDLAYYNPACARCNLETQVSCEPRLSRQLEPAAPVSGKPKDGPKVNQLAFPASSTSISSLDSASQAPPTRTNATTNRFEHEPLDPIEHPEANPMDGGLEIIAARNQDGFQPLDDSDLSRAPGSGSLSVLLDLQGGLQDGDSDEPVGSVHRCNADRQVYDPFLLTCRCIVCGLSYRFEDRFGICVQLDGDKLGDGEASESTTMPQMDSTNAATSSAPSGSALAATRTPPPREQLEPAALTRVNGTAGDKQTSSSDCERESERLIYESSSGQGEAQAGQRVEREDSSNRRDAASPPDRLSVAPATEASTSPAPPEPAGQSAASDEDNRKFAALFSQLKVVRPAMPSNESRKSFAECGKILIQPEHYRLFTMDELNSSQASPELLASRPNPSVWDQKCQRLTWALVAPYNLTLAPGQFQLMRASGRQQLGLLLCSPFKSDLVDKFKPTMVYLTTCCLVVSMTSLVLYLLLYCLSTFDLRYLVVELGQTGQMGHSLQRKVLSAQFRESRASAETSYNSVRSQSLSSRGVACLAAALLAAYLLFVLGHHHHSAAGASRGGLSECALIAAATYGSFLLAFNWMFLLSYDIWRTLRLATCQLRVPTMGSQTSRFLIYATFAALVAGSMACLALVADQLGQQFVDCPGQQRQSEHQLTEQASSSNCSRPLGQLEQSLEQFVLTYRPKFGQRAGSCWFSNRRSLSLFFGLPVTLIMLANLLFFLHSSFMVIKTSSRSSRRLKPTNSTYSHASEPTTGDFAQQNSLTTSSISSVQTTHSSISVQSSCCSSYSSATADGHQEAAAEQERNTESLESAAGGLQREIDEAAKQLDERQPLANGKPHPPLGQTKQASFSGSLASGSQISFTDQLMASSLVHKCDLHLSNLGSVMSSLAKDYRLYCRLSTIMGLTWLTGVAASLVDHSDVLWYLFVVLNSLQGLFIFVAFGLKRSRLMNLKILLVYIDHTLKRKLFTARKPNNNSDMNKT